MISFAKLVAVRGNNNSAFFLYFAYRGQACFLIFFDLPLGQVPFSVPENEQVIIFFVAYNSAGGFDKFQG